jgi:hypothetical protein
MCRIQVLKRGRWDFFSALAICIPSFYGINSFASGVRKGIISLKGTSKVMMPLE